MINGADSYESAWFIRLQFMCLSHEDNRASINASTSQRLQEMLMCFEFGCTVEPLGVKVIIQVINPEPEYN